VQRSSISHLISGRNKPSLEFIQKILSRFPEVNTEWLLNGFGEMLKDGSSPVTGSLQFETSSGGMEEIVGKPEESAPEPVKRESPRISPKKKTVESEDREVEKIIYLYKDKTFREYYPE
jgi:hypothetical protein